MYQVNLLPWREQLQWQRCKFWLWQFALQFLVALLIAIAAYTLAYHQQIRYRAVLAPLQQQQASLTELYQQTQQSLARLTSLTAQATQLLQIKTSNLRYLHFLQSLGSITPQSLWLVALESNEQQITLRGLSPHYAAIELFEKRLNRLPLLQMNQLTEVVRQSDGLFSFTVTRSWSPNE